MQQISENVFIERNYPGVTLGAIFSESRLLLIDSPLRPEDGRHWKFSTQAYQKCRERMVVALDSHPDRTLGIRVLDSQVIGQDRLNVVYRNRPQIFKPPAVDYGAEWERCSNLGTIRWTPPDITFTEKMDVHCGTRQVRLEHHSGPSPCAIWAILPEEKIIFVGDTVTTLQPPFLGNAKLVDWINSLKLLQTEYAGYILVSGRQGIFTMTEVQEMIDFLETVNNGFCGLGKTCTMQDLNGLAMKYLKRYNITEEYNALYERRLKYGISQCYHHNFVNPDADFDEY